ncbi:MAG: penicillin-binding protein activator, partial [Chromatocurvus sp.]
MRRFTHPARRRLCLPLLLAGIAFIAGCGTSPDRPPQRVGAAEDAPGASVSDSTAGDHRPYRDSPYADLFANAESALDSGDWMAAQLALPRSTGTTDPEFTAYEHYIRARIAWQRGDLEHMVETLAGLPRPPMSDALAVKILQLQRERAQLERRHLAAALLSIRMLDRLPTDDPDIPSVSRQAWHALLRVPESALNAATANADNPGEAGWLTAAYLSRNARRTEGWRARHPGHPAEPFLSTGIDVATPRRVALLLPLSGRIADAAAAVRDGFIARYFAQRAAGAIDWDLIVLDTGDHASTRDAYNAAINSGAQLVVGPLTKVA